MRVLPDPLLYTDAAHCLATLRQLPTPAVSSSQASVPVHFYWRGAFGAKPALALKSFLATADPARFTCWLWLDTPATFETAESNPHLAPLLPLLQLRRYQFALEARGTPLAQQEWAGGAQLPAALSDLARLSLLHNHGGIYSDLDALFLRDLSGLDTWTGGQREYCFQWSYLPRGTTAFCRLEAGGKTVLELMRRACAARSAHPTAMLSLDQPEVDHLLMLPVTAFSPLWLRVDRKDRTSPAPFARFADFFRRFGWFFRPQPEIKSHHDFFPGAFTYHWHNQWTAKEHAASYAGLFDRDFNQLLRARHPSLAPLACFGDPPTTG